MYCGKTADWIPTLFGMVRAVSRGKSVLDEGWKSSKGRTVLRVNVGHLIVTNGDFVA